VSNDVRRASQPMRKGEGGGTALAENPFMWHYIFSVTFDFLGNDCEKMLLFHEWQKLWFVFKGSIALM